MVRFCAMCVCLTSAGTDCTEEFEAIHSKKAWSMLEDYYIGQLRPADAATTAAPAAAGPTGPTVTTSTPALTPAPSGDLVALNPKQRIPFALIKRVELSHDSLLLRYALQVS